MGSGEEWANDRRGGCPIVLAGIVSGAILAMWGLVVVVHGVIALALQ